MVYRFPVNVGPNNLEFQRVISGQRLAGLRWQQLGPSLNIKRCMSGAVMVGVPRFESRSRANVDELTFLYLAGSFVSVIAIAWSLDGCKTAAC